MIDPVRGNDTLFVRCREVWSAFAPAENLANEYNDLLRGLLLFAGRIDGCVSQLEYLTGIVWRSIQRAAHHPGCSQKPNPFTPVIGKKYHQVFCSTSKFFSHQPAFVF